MSYPQNMLLEQMAKAIRKRHPLRRGLRREALFGDEELFLRGDVTKAIDPTSNLSPPPASSHGGA